jgi:ATP-dependent helicase/DNAse subunit B
MPLTLVVGPANAGKVARLLDRYLEALERDPFLIVPNRADVDRIQLDLLERAPALIGGSIVTFDALFERIAGGLPDRRRIATDTERLLLARRAIAASRLDGLGRSARFGGFADAFVSVVAELESALLDPAQVGGDVGRLYAAYLEELDRHELWDRDLVRAKAVDRLAADFEAWRGEPVFAYGFEDLTAAEWRLVEALAARADVTVSLPYEPGRVAFASLEATAGDLARLANGSIEELPPRFDEVAPPALAFLERRLFEQPGSEAPPLDGSIRFLEGGGTRGTLELVAEDVLALLRAGLPAEGIGLVCPSLERLRTPLETVLGALGVPFSLEGTVPLGRTPFGHALVALARFAWLGGDRESLYGFLRSPYSGVARREVDFAEGRLRGNAIAGSSRVEEETEKLRGKPLPALERLRSEPPLRALRELSAGMLENAHSLEEPPTSEAARHDLRCLETAVRVLDELTSWRDHGGEVSPEDVVGVLERAPVALSRPAEPGRVAVLDFLRARTRRFAAIFVLGLEEGSFPRRGLPSPFLDDDARRALGARLVRPDQVSRDRYLFYTAATRATQRLTLVREAATDDGSPREPSPFWEEVRALFPAGELARWTRRRQLARLIWPLEEAPSERERLRALAALDAEDAPMAWALARANGWQRRLQRARGAFSRPTALRHPLVLEQLGSRTTFNVTELERFADCSSAWFVERFLDPRTIDAQVDAKLRGSVAHQTLYRFFTGLPKELGVERLDESRVEDAVGFMRRCLDESLSRVRLEMTDLQRSELEQTLWRDLEALVRAEAESELSLEPRRFEVLFGSERAAPELQRGLDLGGLALSGKIDRIDVDPFSARAIVVDYKSGKGAHSARQIDQELRLQIPLYMLVLRDLIGYEPLGGVYRPLGGDRRMRGLLRREARLPGFVRTDQVDDDDFWVRVEGARETARGLAERIRAGDVQHDPRGGECPPWCELWPMCRVRRS